MIRLLTHPHPPSPVSKLSLFLSLPVWSQVELTDGGGEGVGEEPNHATARKPGPLYIIQYSLVRAKDVSLDFSDTDKCWTGRSSYSTKGTVKKFVVRSLFHVIVLSAILILFLYMLATLA